MSAPTHDPSRIVAAVRLTRAVLSLPVWALGVLLCALASVIHWSTKASFKATSDMFDPERYW